MAQTDSSGARYQLIQLCYSHSGGSIQDRPPLEEDTRISAYPAANFMSDHMIFPSSIFMESSQLVENGAYVPRVAEFVVHTSENPDWL